MTIFLRAVIVAAIASLINLPCALAEPMVLTFEGLKSGEGIENYYNGGTGSQGSGPGTNFGVAFKSPLIDNTPTALAYIPTTPFPNDPSPPTVMLLAIEGSAGSPVSTNMDVAAGFQGALTFYYAAIDRDAKVQIYSGLDGAGTKLASIDLTPTDTTNGVFDPNPIDLSFNGVAQSAVFSGGNQQAAFDNIGIQSVPEPASFGLMTLGLTAALAFRYGKKKEARAEAPDR